MNICPNIALGMCKRNYTHSQKLCVNPPKSSNHLNVINHLPTFCLEANAACAFLISSKSKELD